MPEQEIGKSIGSASAHGALRLKLPHASLEQGSAAAVLAGVHNVTRRAACLIGEGVLATGAGLTRGRGAGNAHTRLAE
jgi:hypothetical protein